MGKSLRTRSGSDDDMRADATSMPCNIRTSVQLNNCGVDEIGQEQAHRGRSTDHDQHALRRYTGINHGKPIHKLSR